MSAAAKIASFNRHGVLAIYRFELSRFKRTVWQSLVTPVITTSLYFVVFGAAIGSRMSEVGRRALRLLHRAGADHAVAVYRKPQQCLVRDLPAEVHRHYYEVLSAPVSALEIVLAYVGAAATKSVILGLVILATATLFVPMRIEHPLWMIAFLALTAATFSLFGFIIGIWAKGFEQLAVHPDAGHYPRLPFWAGPSIRSIYCRPRGAR